MGLISLIVGYSFGKGNGRRRANKRYEQQLDDMFEQCAVCGNYAIQHDAEGFCPEYP